MSFFILVNNNIHEYEFPYLNKNTRTNEDDTIAPSGKIYRFKKDHQGSAIYAKNLMTKVVQNLQSSDKVKKAIKAMETLDIHHIPITSGNKIMGIVSSSDIKALKGEPSFEELKLDRVMEKAVLCVSESTPLRHILEVFVHEYIHCLPVVDENLFMVGIITQNDIFKWMLQNKEYLK